MELLLWAVALGAGVGAEAGGTGRRGPHHPREEPLPPGTRRHHGPHDKLTHDQALMHDTVHLQEDLGRPLENMTDEELEFHYFKLHDFDSNTLLDGLEMLKAIYHTMDHDHNEAAPEEKGDEAGRHDSAHVPNAPTQEEMDKFIELIDRVLEEDDLDRDGYISYPEFALGRAGGKALNLNPNIAVQV